jgi:hypothetical protein
MIYVWQVILISYTSALPFKYAPTVRDQEVAPDICTDDFVIFSI